MGSCISVTVSSVEGKDITSEYGEGGLTRAKPLKEGDMYPPQKVITYSPPGPSIFSDLQTWGVEAITIDNNKNYRRLQQNTNALSIRVLSKFIQVL